MSKSIFSLEDKTILITGASSGIGRAAAQECAAVGARCIITGRNEARLNDVYNSLPGSGHIMYTADLTDCRQIDSLVEQLPPLNGIVCCAGVVETQLLKFSSDIELIKIFETNTFSVIRLIRELVKNKILVKEASVVIVSSVSGVKCGYIGGSIYGASKGALEGFVKAAAIELSSKKIRVNTIVPGMINTSLLKESSIDDELLKADMLKYPLKRYGEPKEVAYSAVYLLSDATKWVTGTSLIIDGGYTLN